VFHISYFVLLDVLIDNRAHKEPLHLNFEKIRTKQTSLIPKIFKKPKLEVIRKIIYMHHIRLNHLEWYLENFQITTFSLKSKDIDYTNYINKQAIDPSWTGFVPSSAICDRVLSIGMKATFCTKWSKMKCQMWLRIKIRSTIPSHYTQWKNDWVRRALWL
jgi:hypothetical protein